MARPGLDKNVKYRTLIRLLALPRPYVRGLLETLWDVAHESGNPVLGSPDAVEAAAEWPGDPGKFFAAMRDCRLIDQRGHDRWEIHDYWDHAPEYAAGRATRELERTKEKKCETCGDNYHSSDPRSKHCSPACRTAKWRGSVTDGDGNVRHTRRSVTECDGTHNTQHPTPNTPLGEVSPKNPSCPEPQAASGQADAPATTAAITEQHHGEGAALSAGHLDPDPVVLLFPVVGGKRGKGPAEWPLRQSKVAEYSETFPAVDVLAECRKALQWCRDNPAKRKTFRGIAAFLTRWLGKCQDRGGNGKAIPRPAASETLAEKFERLAKEKPCPGSANGRSGTPPSSASPPRPT